MERYDLKRRAKASMKGAYPHPMLVALVFVLLTASLNVLVNVLVSNPFTEIYQYLQAGYDPFLIIERYSHGNRLLLYRLLMLLLSLYSTVVSFGYTSYGLRLARGESPSFRNLLDGFHVVGRVIAASLLILLFTFLWSMAVMVIPVVVLYTWAFLTIDSMDPQYGLLAVVILLFLVAYIGLVLITSRYRLTYYFMLDHPEMGALEALRCSKGAMRGHIWQYIVLNLSFLGWILLIPFTLGILSLWVLPYMEATMANFYDAISSRPPLHEPLPGGEA